MADTEHLPELAWQGEIYAAAGPGGEDAFSLPPPSAGSAKSFTSITVPWHLSDSCAPCINCMKPERKRGSMPGTLNNRTVALVNVA